MTAMTMNSRPLSDAERAELKMLTSMQERTPLENERRNYLVSIHNAAALDSIDVLKKAAARAGVDLGGPGRGSGRRRR
jgi:hypothetical protein